MRASSASLTSLEIAVAGGGAALAWLRMSGFIPRHMEQPGSRHSKPAARKMGSRPSSSACLLTSCEPGAHHRADGRRNMMSLHDSSSSSQIADARVRARADKDAVHRNVFDTDAGLQVHIFEGAREALAVGFAGRILDGGNHGIHTCNHSR